MRLKLARHDLCKASTANLLRLAQFLQLPIAQENNESEGAFRHRLVAAIQRWEKWECRKPQTLDNS